MMMLCVFLRVFFSLILDVILFTNSKAEKTEEIDRKCAQEKGSVTYEDTILRSIAEVIMVIQKRTNGFPSFSSSKSLYA